jgi:hypothetical protein
MKIENSFHFMTFLLMNKSSFAHFQNLFSVACIIVAPAIKQLPKSTKGATLPSSSWFTDAAYNWSFCFFEAVFRTWRKG